MAKVWITLNGNHFIGGKVRRAGTAIEVDEKLAKFVSDPPKKETAAPVIAEPVAPVETEPESETADEPKPKRTRKAKDSEDK